MEPILPELPSSTQNVDSSKLVLEKTLLAVDSTLHYFRKHLELKQLNQELKDNLIAANKANEILKKPLSTLEHELVVMRREYASLKADLLKDPKFKISLKFQGDDAANQLYNIFSYDSLSMDSNSASKAKTILHESYSNKAKESKCHAKNHTVVEKKNLFGIFNKKDVLTGIFTPENTKVVTNMEGTSACSSGVTSDVNESEGVEFRVKIHQWKTSTVHGDINCSFCSNKVNGFSNSCQQCYSVVHSDCKLLTSVMCKPLSQKLKESLQINISTKVIMKTPVKDLSYVPALIVKCVREIESRNLSHIHFNKYYASSSGKKEVKKLMRKILKNEVGFDFDVSTHSLYSCIRIFLKNWKEPLITYQYWELFAAASEVKDEHLRVIKMESIIDLLEKENKCTLAYLVVHFKRVVAANKDKTMIEDLSSFFGPCIVGYPDCNPEDITVKKFKQFNIMSALLLHPAKNLENILIDCTQIDQENLNPEHSFTPTSTKVIAKKYKHPRYAIHSNTS